MTTTKPKHTQGPWTWAESAINGALAPQVFGPDGMCLANVNIRPYHADNRPEADANARLIAAAPYLLEEHELEAAWLESVLHLHNEGLAVPKMLREQVGRRLIAIRAAILKAGGEGS